jgi:lysophospholipase L1-like esterase
MGLLTLSLAGGPAESIAWLTVPDVQGSYTFPYIQSDRDLRVLLTGSELANFRVVASLRDPTSSVSGHPVIVTAEQPEAVFHDLAPGEYALAVELLDPAGRLVRRLVYTRIGVGAVLAAVGDSLTEGYLGRAFQRESLNLKASDFPASAVSRDGRNFPQFGPTTHQYYPAISCFQSWMTTLNDTLSAAWKQPVFIANEGNGGYTAADTLAMIRENRGGWRTRMEQLRPTTWLIHLGVNDERAKVPAAVFAHNMGDLVDMLVLEFHACPENIYLARPSYDYADGAEAILKSYITEINRLVVERKLRAGPDLFAAFSTDQAKWYGEDPVHPGAEGMEWMAQLWADKLSAREGCQ